MAVTPNAANTRNSKAAGNGFGKCRGVWSTGSPCNRWAEANGFCPGHQQQQMGPQQQMMQPQMGPPQVIPTATNVMTPNPTTTPTTTNTRSNKAAGNGFGKCRGVWSTGSPCNRWADANGFCPGHQAQVPQQVPEQTFSMPAGPGPSRQMMMMMPSNNIPNQSNNQSNNQSIHPPSLQASIGAILAGQGYHDPKFAPVCPSVKSNNNNVYENNIYDNNTRPMVMYPDGRMYYAV
jgi:hypothetical protein